jgi:hypothetical protein
MEIQLDESHQKLNTFIRFILEVGRNLFTDHLNSSLSSIQNHFKAKNKALNSFTRETQSSFTITCNESNIAARTKPTSSF